MATSASAELPAFLTGRIPFWLAVAITAIVSLPFGLYLGKFNLPLWVSFIVWGQYFALGASPRVLRTIYPNYIFGALWTALCTPIYVWLAGLSLFPDPIFNTFFSLSVYLFICLGILVWLMNFGWLIANTGLPLFQGATLLLAVYFTGSQWQLSKDPYVVVLLAGLTTVVAGVAGGLFGWFNEVITFPRRTTTQT
jgi:hypothetical protein